MMLKTWLLCVRNRQTDRLTDRLSAILNASVRGGRIRQAHQAICMQLRNLTLYQPSSVVLVLTYVPTLASTESKLCSIEHRAVKQFGCKRTEVLKTHLHTALICGFTRPHAAEWNDVGPPD